MESRDSHGERGYTDRKRERNDDRDQRHEKRQRHQYGDRSEKPKAYEPKFNFDVQKSFRVAEDVPLPKNLPSVEVEYFRSKEIQGLREYYKDLCQENVKIPAPDESFNRWLFEQLAIPREGSQDALLAYPDLAKESLVIKREILNALPASLYISWGARSNQRKALDVLRRYCKKALEWIDLEKENKVEGDQLPSPEVVKKDLKDLEDWIYDARDISVEDVKDKFDHVKKTISPFFAALFTPRVNVICEKLVEASNAVAQRIREKEARVKETPNSSATEEKENEKEEREEEKEVDDERKEVRLEIKQGVCYLGYKDDSREITEAHYRKLLRLYQLHNPSEDHFVECLYVLVRRYATFFGLSAFEGATFHAAAPETVFEALHEDLGVTHENFASPFNCYFANFNSAFPDIDVFFGSCGSFFDFYPIEGSFETGPPYTEEVMERMANHLNDLLSSSNFPLSFVVFVPDWQNPLAAGLEIMGSSSFLVEDFVVKGRQHSYVVGHQHVVGDNQRSKERYFLLPFATHVYILQNSAGKNKWPVTPQNLERLKDALYTRF